MAVYDLLDPLSGLCGDIQGLVSGVFVCRLRIVSQRSKVVSIEHVETLCSSEIFLKKLRDLKLAGRCLD
jgi:hypothetical protein